MVIGVAGSGKTTLEIIVALFLEWVGYKVFIGTMVGMAAVRAADVWRTKVQLINAELPKPKRLNSSIRPRTLNKLMADLNDMVDCEWNSKGKVLIIDEMSTVSFDKPCTVISMLQVRVRLSFTQNDDGILFSPRGCTDSGITGSCILFAVSIFWMSSSLSLRRERTSRYWYLCQYRNNLQKLTYCALSGRAVGEFSHGRLLFSSGEGYLELQESSRSRIVDRPTEADCQRSMGTGTRFWTDKSISQTLHALLTRHAYSLLAGGKRQSSASLCRSGHHGPRSSSFHNGSQQARHPSRKQTRTRDVAGL